MFGASSIEASVVRGKNLRCMATPERVPIKWNHLIDKDSLKIKELEHVLIEKLEQLFRDMLYASTKKMR